MAKTTLKRNKSPHAGNFNSRPPMPSFHHLTPALSRREPSLPFAISQPLQQCIHSLIEFLLDDLFVAYHTVLVEDVDTGPAVDIVLIRDRTTRAAVPP